MPYVTIGSVFYNRGWRTPIPTSEPVTFKPMATQWPMERIAELNRILKDHPDYCAAKLIAIMSLEIKYGVEV